MGTQLKFFKAPHSETSLMEIKDFIEAGAYPVYVFPNGEKLDLYSYGIKNKVSSWMLQELVELIDKNNLDVSIEK